MTRMQLTSADVRDAEPIPLAAAHGTAGGDNISPQLSWTPGPPGTRSYAVTCWDPDEPTGVGFVHWVVFNIPPGVTLLAAGAGAEGANPVGSELGFTDWGETGYGGPAPTPGDPPHRYEFTLYALDVPRLELDGPATTYAMLQCMMRGHIVASATLTGTFETRLVAEDSVA